MKCEAYQQNDQMHCPTCGLLWDMNDPDPPECKPARVDAAVGLSASKLGSQAPWVVEIETPDGRTATGRGPNIAEAVRYAQARLGLEPGR